jgi:single-stranded DNA-binding protein
MERAAMAKCEIVVRGNLGADVESKVSKAGKIYYVLRVGSTPSKKNISGEWENGETMWFSVTSFEELNPFEFVKGTPVEVHGSFVFRTYTKRDGALGFALDVVANKIERVIRDQKKVEFAQDDLVPESWTPIALNLDDAPF